MMRILIITLLLTLPLVGQSTTKKKPKPPATQQTAEESFVKELRPKAELGQPDAQFLLGVGYNQGLGVPKNTSEALKWLRKAAGQGHVKAQWSIGYMYYIIGLGY